MALLKKLFKSLKKTIVLIFYVYQQDSVQTGEDNLDEDIQVREFFSLNDLILDKTFIRLLPINLLKLCLPRLSLQAKAFLSIYNTKYIVKYFLVF